MKKEREELDLILEVLFQKNNSNSTLRETMEENLFIAKKFRVGVVNKVYNLRTKCEELTEEELYLITKELFDNFDLTNYDDSDFEKAEKIKVKNKINPDNWFTDNEIINANKIKLTRKEGELFFELENVDQFEDGGRIVWGCSHESYANLAENMRRHSIDWKEETQREGVIKTRLGESITIPKLYGKNISAMQTKMGSNQYYFNTLTFNIEDLTGDNIDYYPVTRKLRVSINDNCSVYCLDGYHRISSIQRLMQADNKAEGFMMARIFSVPVDKAQEIVIQETLGNQIDLSHIKKIDKSNPYMLGAETLNNFGNKLNNSMNQRLTGYIEEVKKGSKYCLFANISNGLEENFSDLIHKDTVKYESDKVISYLVDFYNIYLGIFDKEFKSLKTTKQKTVLADINVFTGLMAIAKMLYNKPDWKSKLELILTSIDFNRDNKEWNTLKMNSTVWIKATKEDIYEYFINKAKIIIKEVE